MVPVCARIDPWIPNFDPWGLSGEFLLVAIVTIQATLPALFPPVIVHSFRSDWAIKEIQFGIGQGATGPIG